MPTYEIGQYELHAMTYRVKAKSEAEAIVKLFRGEAEPVEHREIPLGELAMRRGTHVEATDGPVGHVDEFVVTSKTGQITHLVMRDGHAWAPKEVIIPASALGEVRHDTLFLKLDKRAIEALPTFPIERWWA